MNDPMNDDIPIDTLHLIIPNPQWNGETGAWDSIYSYRRLIPMTESDEYPIAKKYDPDTGWCAKLNINGFRLEGSLSRLKYKDNLNPLTASDFPIFLEYLNHLQSILGLSFDPQSLRIARVDIFRHIEVHYPASLFIGKLAKVHRFQHLQQRSSSELYDCGYVRWQNKSRELVIYNKTAQATKRGNKP